MLTNANMNNALDIAGQSLGEKKEREFLFSSVSICFNASYLFFPAPRRKYFVIDMNDMNIDT